jgi:MtN3 and saliva related transmembrane protein
VKAELLGMTAGFITSIAIIPQLVRTWRIKHAKDISIWQPLLLTLGMALWLAYGILLKDMPLIAANTFSLLCYLLMIAMKLYYDKRCQ